MVVSCTNTLGHFYGAQEKVNGFYLNSSLKSFGTKGINKYEPGKRPRTYTSPTIIQKGNDYIMGIGTPGGIRILKMLAPIIVDNLYFGNDLQEAINKSRVIFQEPGMIVREGGRDEDYITIPIYGLKRPTLLRRCSSRWNFKRKILRSI